mmetsp:Transcript_17732/g.24955  ORF Transcript_17732/g.24955 Transcript_17732/m.24955 type:complete len:277 (+) Transcript_17732:1073-1903(+)
MLGDVCNTCIGVLPDISGLGFNFTNEKLNHCRLTSTVLSNTCDTGTERNLDSDVEKSRLIVSGVGEGTSCHFHKSLTLGLNSLNRTGLGETELLLRFSERKVRASRRLDLDEFIEVTLEGMKLQVLNLKDVGTAVVEKTRVVTDNDGGNISERVEVVLNPGNVNDIQVVSRLIKKKDVSLLKHSTGKSELHTPPTREGGHSVVRLGLSIRGETDSCKHSTDFLLVNVKSLDLRVNGNIVNTGKMGLFSLNISLDEDGTDFGNIGETLDLVIGDGSH